MSADRELPGISVIVIGRNEGPRLTRCLESVYAADYPRERLEIIYVDTASTDDSCARAEALGAKVVRIAPDRPSAAAARNAGLAEARHAFVHFFDGDTILNPQWLRHALPLMDDAKIGCVFGRREEMRPRASLYMRVASLDWHVSAGPALYCGGDALFRRAVLAQAGGFDAALIAGEEPELCYRIRRLGYTIWRSDVPMTLHDLDMTRFRQYWSRGVRSGWAFVVVAAVCRRDPARLWRRENVTIVGEIVVWLCLLALAVVLRQPWWCLLLVAWVGLRTLLIARTVRSRTDSWTTSVLYGLNCQFMRIPLFIGQLRGFWFLLVRRPARLIEYK